MLRILGRYVYEIKPLNDSRYEELFLFICVSSEYNLLLSS